FWSINASHPPEPAKTAETWRREALCAGLKDLFLVRVESFRDDCGDPREIGFDSGLQFQPQASLGGTCGFIAGSGGISGDWARMNRRYDYELLMSNALAAPAPAYPRISCVCPAWDNSPRRARGLYNSCQLHPGSLRNALART